VDADHEPPPSEPSRRERRPPWAALVLAAGVVGLSVAGILARDELRAALERLDDVVRGAGWAGPVLFVLVYVAWTVACLPASVLTLVAGAIFADRPLVAIATVWIGAMLGAATSFLVARHLARESVRRWIGRHGKLSALDLATETHGAWFVAIVRLVPLFPFNVVNYGFGLTRIRFLPYVAISAACMLPGTVLYVLAAVALARGLRGHAVPWGALAGAAAALLVILAAGLVARRAASRAKRP
jgi:uncharacterized membrane protein YdjX (TVP38/TMEM64 family)